MESMVIKSAEIKVEMADTIEKVSEGFKSAGSPRKDNLEIEISDSTEKDHDQPFGVSPRFPTASSPSKSSI